MSSYTSTQSGNWANASTWGNSGPPGDGDTAIIANGHTVTIASGTSVIVGNSAVPTTPAIQTAVAGSGTGLLVVDVGATLTVKANLAQGNARWQFNAFSTLNFLHATANLTWTIADGNNQANALPIFNGGTGANRVIVRSTGAANCGGFGWFGINWSGAGQMQAAGVQFTGIGTATLPMFNIQGSATYVGSFTDCLFTSCGKIATSNQFPVGSTFSFTRCTWRTPLSSDFRIIELNLAAGVQTGIAFTDNCWEGTFYVAGASGVSGVRWVGDNIGSSYGATGIPLDCTTVPHSATVDRLFLYNKISTSGNPSTLMNGTLKVASLRTGALNQHALQIAVRAPTVISGGVFEFGSTDESGDELQVIVNPAAPQTCEITGNIQPPGPDGITGAGSFVNISHAGSSANNRLNIHHNTVFTSAFSAAPAGCLMFENTTGGAGAIAALRDNIFYGTGWAVFQVNGALTDGTITNADYNDKPTPAGDGYQPADVAFATPTPPGSHDIAVDPGFYDSTRRFLPWGQSINPALTTIQQVFDEMFRRNDDSGFTSTFTPTAYLNYMSAGFAPTNAAVRTAGHDGSVLGAVAFLQRRTIALTASKSVAFSLVASEA